MTSVPGAALMIASEVSLPALSLSRNRSILLCPRMKSRDLFRLATLFMTQMSQPGDDSVRRASSLDEGEEVEKPFEHGDGPIGRAGRDHAVGSKISWRGIGAPLSSGSGFCTSKYMSVPVVRKPYVRLYGA